MIKLLINYFNYGIFSNTIRLEASSICQLKCPECSTGTDNMGIIGRGYLKFKDFKKVIDNNLWIKNIELSNFGEIFLNPELKEIIKYAFIKNINLSAGNGVNLNNINEETVEYLVKYKFKYLSISIDGASNKTYKIYRKGGNFDKVIENIKKINYYKQKHNSKFPKLCWQFIIFGHNEHELPIARKMAKKLNMDFKPKLNWNPSYSPIKNKEFVKKNSGLNATSREEFKQKKKKDYILPCLNLLFSPQINWDGKVLGCCFNKWADFGNAFETSLKRRLKSDKYKYAKKMLLGLKKAREDIPCSKCGIYKKLKSSGHPFIIFSKQIPYLIKRYVQKYF